MKKYKEVIKEINKETAKHRFCWDSSTQLPAIEALDRKIQKIIDLPQIKITKIEGILGEVDIPLGLEISETIKKHLIKNIKKEKKIEMAKIIEKWEEVK